MPGDYDGDGKTDMAVYRDGTWFILRSFDGGVTATGWGGLPQDVPVPADYDGDGKSTLRCIAMAIWFVLRSSDGDVTYEEWGGLPQDIPVSADYDGDGKADIAVYRDGTLVYSSLVGWRSNHDRLGRASTGHRSAGGLRRRWKDRHRGVSGWDLVYRSIV